MEDLGRVQQKISCIFKTAVLNEDSSKRSHQPYKVVATDVIRPEAVNDDVCVARATEKLDGTCVYIDNFQGKPWLWARLDRKPNKAAEKKFRKFQSQQQQSEKDGNPETEQRFDWNVQKDFKEVTEHWIPASGVPLLDGQPQPDTNGHIPGWVPVDPKSRQHCWHLSAVDLKLGLGILLRESKEESDDLTVELVPLSEIKGHTAELVGTNVNGNPYGIGSKKFPLHFLVIHGSVPMKSPPEQKLGLIKEWFDSSEYGKVEGVVWHCHNGSMYKLHRHHLNLPWPVKVQQPYFSQRKVTISSDLNKFDQEEDKNYTIWMLSQYSGHICDSLTKLCDLFTSQDSVS